MTDLKRAIAYSTMSQIGYMFIGVSIGAYSAGLFHLMTHAFFKALLFMAAGSIIAAMANDQNIDRMAGFGRAMRFTSATMLAGGLALAAFPFTSGFFSKDEILAYASARGGMYLIFTVLGYLGALLTAIYTFRLIFRILPGAPCKEAQELMDTGHVAHEQPRNPATGEIEDTGVGFPGAEHHIAEQSASMRVAMAVLAFGALFAGFVQIPGVDNVDRQFPRPRLRRLAAERDPPLDRGELARAGDRRRDLAGRDRDRLLALCGASRAAGRAAEALRRPPPLPLQQVVLRRADRHPRRPAGAGDRALRQPAPSSGSSSTGSSPAPPTRSAAPAASSASSRAASSAATRCC